MNKETWKMIEQFYLKYRNAYASPVKPELFDSLVQPYCANLDPDYREFVLRYGGGLVGSDAIYGLREAKMIGRPYGKATAPELTQLFRDKNWPGVANWFIFTIPNGNPVGFEKDGTVWISDINFGQISQLAENFEDYLLKWCLRVRKVE